MPVASMLSMFDPVYFGIDEYGLPVYVPLIYKNLISAGEPGAGKSTLLNSIVAHGALSADCRLCLFDGKLVEFGPWAQVADEFVGPDLDHAIRVLRRLQQVMNNRYAWLLAHRRKKITRGDGLHVLLVVIDEIALYSATLGDKNQRETFSMLLRDLVARGRACGLVVVAATQRPNIDIIPTSLRDIFGYRHAGRCTTDNSSDLVLGHGWASRGYTAASILPTQQGVGYLLDEGGTPRLVKSPWLSEDAIQHLADYAAWTRRPTRVDTPEPADTATTPTAPTHR